MKNHLNVFQRAAQCLLVPDASFDKIDVPADLFDIPAVTRREVIDDPHLAATGFIQTVRHPSEGVMRILGIPGTWSDSQPNVTSMAPRLGQHSREVLMQAGFAEQEVDRLIAACVILQDSDCPD